MTHVQEPWPRGRSRDGGIDPLGVPGLAGRLWLCGKHLVGPDPEGALARVGAVGVVCLTEAHEVADRYPEYLHWLRGHDPSAGLWFPIPDLHAPAPQAALVAVDGMIDHLRCGRDLLLHCAAGIGRTGAIAAAVLLRRGVGLRQAEQEVAAARPGAGPQSAEQAAFLTAFASLVGVAG